MFIFSEDSPIDSRELFKHSRKTAQTVTVVVIDIHLIYTMSRCTFIHINVCGILFDKIFLQLSQAVISASQEGLCSSKLVCRGEQIVGGHIIR